MNPKRRVALAVSAALLPLALFASAAFSSSTGNGPAAGPLALYAFAGGERVSFDGRVVDRAEAGPYVYLELERTDGARAWIVTLASSRGAAPGLARVHVVAVGHASHFVSKRLSRSFDDLYFAVVRPA